MSDDPKSRLSIGAIEARRDVIVAGVIGEIRIYNGEPTRSPARPIGPPPPLDAGAAAPALAALRRQETCVYLGGRYGLTPHSLAPPKFFEGLELGVAPPPCSTLGEAISFLADTLGLAAAKRHLAEVYGLIDILEKEPQRELVALAPHLSGHFVATGTWSARIQNALGSNIEVLQDEPQGHFRPGGGRRTRLLMLHGSEQSFQTALVAQDDVASYGDHRGRLAAVVEELLTSPWVALGASRATDATFLLMVRSVSRSLGSQPPPIYVIDPRTNEEVAREWPREALRHLRMTPAQFLKAAKAQP